MARVADNRGRPHSGVMPYAVVGIVVDNVDPERLGRVKVKFPTLDGDPESFWLRQVSPNAGIERGLYALPEVDDEVLVLFLQGSHDHGVILGQFWNGVDKPPTEAMDGMPGSSTSQIAGAQKSTDTFNDGSTDIEENDRRFWRSRSGHLVVFDDTSGSETVQIWDGSHTLCLVFDTANQRIVLANNAGDLHIRTANDLYLEAGNDLIWHAGNNIDGESVMSTIHKAGTDYTFESGTSSSMTAGTSFDIEAGTDFTAKANVGATVEGSVSFTGKGGASATLDGGASTTVKGGVVMIN